LSDQNRLAKGGLRPPLDPNPEPAAMSDQNPELSDTKAPSPKPRRTVRMEVRLTPDEELKLIALAGGSGANVSDYVRARSLGHPVPRTVATDDRKALIELLGELGKIGSNLNQVARHLNQGNPVDQERDSVRQVTDSLASLHARILKAL
jgi:hypothetical protein